MNMKKIMSGLMASVVLATTMSCPNPLSREMLLHVKDGVGPVITIQSPPNGISYPATVEVIGTVEDFSTYAGDEGSVRSIHYEILGTSVTGDVFLLSDHSFRFTFATTNLSGTIEVKVTAEDWNGNQSSASLRLVEEGAIPSFQADPGNGQVTLSWAAVPLADRYTLYYEKADIIPTEQYSLKIENAASPVTLTGLRNGNMHAFLLQAHSMEGEDNWSEVVKAIPLAPAQLAPIVVPAFKEIIVEWNPIPATDTYEVWKASSPEAIPVNVSGTIRRTSFHDTAVQPGHWYYYAVRSAVANAKLSMPNAAELASIPRNEERETGAFGPSLYASGVALNGLYAYIAGGYGGLRILNIENAASPTGVGSYDTPGNASAVAVKGSYAYVADYDYGLRIINIANPASPYEVGCFDTPGGAIGIAVSGSYAYVTNSLSKLYIFNIANPAFAQKESSFDTLGYAFKVTVSGSYAYVVDSMSGLQIINIDNPASPSKAGFYGIPGGPWAVAISGSYAYVADFSSGLRILDLWSPD